MENQRDERVIFIKDLIFAALYQWRKIVIVAVALALVLGAVGLSKALGASGQTILVGEEPPEEGSAERIRLEGELLLLEQKLADTQAQIKNQEQYLAQSPIMAMDPYQVYTVSSILSVQTDYQILPGMTYQNTDPAASILGAYETLLWGEELIQAVAQSADLQSKYLTELISVNNGGTYTRSLSITVTHPTAEGAQQIMDGIVAQLQAAQPQVTQAAGAHTVSILPGSVAERIMLDIGDKQVAATERLRTLYTTLEETDTAIEDTQKLLAGPVAEVVDGPNAIKQTVIYAVVGGILGVVLAVGIVWVAHIASSKVYSARTLTNRTGIKVLGCVPSPGKRCRLDIWLRTREGRGMAENMAAVAAANVRNHTVGKLLLMGDADAQSLEQIGQALSESGVQATVCGSPLRSVEALDALTQCDSVVLVEKCGVSRYHNVSAEIQLVLDQSKQLAGCVLLDG